MQNITKYDYCQACHLLLTECKCEAVIQAKAGEVANTTGEVFPIWLTNWKININKVEKLITNVLAKGRNEKEIKNNEFFVRRALRDANIPASAKVDIVSVHLIRKIGESFIKN